MFLWVVYQWQIKALELPSFKDIIAQSSQLLSLFTLSNHGSLDTIIIPILLSDTRSFLLHCRADLTEESIVNNRPSSFRDNCYCCCFVVLVVLVILSVIIGLSWLGVYYGTRSTSLASSIKTNGLRQLLEVG